MKTMSKRLKIGILFLAMLVLGNGPVSEVLDNSIKILDIISVNASEADLGEGTTDSLSSGTKNESSTDFETITLGQDSAQQITMEYSYGYNFYGKYGRQMPIFAKLENRSNTDFHGWLEATIPLVENGQVYRKEVSVQAGESGKLSMMMPLSGGFGGLDINLVDDLGGAILESTNTIKQGNYEKILFAGILTDTPENLEYIDNLAIKSFLFNTNSFPEEHAYLDLMDILIINDFDTSTLNNNQIDAIKQWVLDGGTLVFGTGENASKVISHVADEFDIGVSGVTGEDILDQNNLKFIEANITDHIDESYIEDLKTKIRRFEEERNILRAQIEDNNKYLEAYDNPTLAIRDISKSDWPSAQFEEYANPNVTKTLANVIFLEETIGEAEVLESPLADISALTTQLDGETANIYQKKTLGQGNILLYNFNLSIANSTENIADGQITTEPVNPAFKPIIISSITSNLSPTKQSQITSELSGSSTPYGIMSSMTYTDTENIPKVSSYIIILVIYILIIGPITYMILRKKDKQSLVWLVVPGLSIVFTFIIYLAGSKTRVNEPFVGYVEMTTYNDDNIVENELYFSLTAPQNESYSLEFELSHEQINLIGEGNEFPSYNQHQIKTDPKKYTAAVNYSRDNTELEINNTPAFTPVFFETSNKYIGKNPMEGNINYTGDKIEGTISNMSDYTITNAIYIGDTFLFNIGAINSGETIDIDDVEKVYINNMNDIYYSDVIRKVVSEENLVETKDTGNTDNSLERELDSSIGDVNRKTEIIYSLIDKLISDGSYKNCIMGFVEGNSANDSGTIPFFEEISSELDVYGTKAILAEVNVDYSKDDALLVPSISSLVRDDGIGDYGIGEAEYAEDYYQTDISGEETIIEYYLPKKGRIISVEYYTLSNQKPISEYNTSFAGNIYGLNRKTGGFDHLFTANISGNNDTTLIRQDVLGDYLSNDNVLTLKFEPYITQMDSTMLLPNISYWKGEE